MIILTSDRGSAFTAHIAGEIFKILGIQKIKTTAHHPQSNGVVEIFNKTLKTTLKIWTNENQNDWDEYLQFVMFSYNTAFHSLMKETPFFFMSWSSSTFSNRQYNRIRFSRFKLRCSWLCI